MGRGDHSSRLTQEMFPVSLTLLVVPSWHCKASFCRKAIILLIFYPAELWLFEAVSHRGGGGGGVFFTFSF